MTTTAHRDLGMRIDDPAPDKSGPDVVGAPKGKHPL